MDRSSASGSTPAWTEGPGGRLATRGHTVPQPKAVTRESTAATCFTNGRVRARGAPMIVPGVPARPRPVNRSPCIAAVAMRLEATPDDAPRPSRRALPPLPRRDVGALLVLRDARAARAVSGPVDTSPARPHRLRQSRARLVTRRREPPLWMVHRPRLPAPDRRRVDRRPSAGHAPLDGHRGPPDRARPPRAPPGGRGSARTAGPRLCALSHPGGVLGGPATAVPGRGVALVLVVLVIGWAVRFVARLEPNERGPTATIFVFMLFNAVFWLAFEQAGSSLNLFTDLHTNRMLGGFEVPTTWFQSVNAGLIFLLAPLFAGLWSWLGHRGRDPGQPVKIALGLGFLSLGYVFMVWAGRVAADPGVKASMAFVLATYFWHTVGELCLSPTGLSYVTKAAPERYVSFLMGVWFISTFLANLGGGLVASQVEAIERGEVALPWHLGGQADFFMLFVVSAGAAGLLIFLLAPRLGRLTRGAV